MVMYVMYGARYLELHIQVGRTGGQICSLISELVFFSERGGPPGGGHTKWKCTLILQKNKSSSDKPYAKSRCISIWCDPLQEALPQF